MTPTVPTTQDRFIDRLRRAGIEPGDDDELRLNKTLLAFATGLIGLAAMLWVAIYWLLGQRISTTAPMIYQLLLVANLLWYIRSGNFAFFRVSQIGLFLFGPFAMQWGFGNVIDSSGVILWGLLAPVGAILCFGVRESAPWFFAWLFMTALSGLFDFVLISPHDRFPFEVPIRTAVVFFALNFIVVASIIYMLLRYSIQEKQKMKVRLEEAHGLLKLEQARSERLLLNILPEPVAQRLKAGEQPIADGFAEVTVMFADVVNFTQVAAYMTPNQVFAMLNGLFSAFDELAERNGLEKIKTIGDAYMIAGGIDDGNTDYTAAVADMALAMRDLLRRDAAINPARLELRIGIGTGPVVAGVVGKKKFIYDLWGDTVNLASRITAEGAPGGIQCDAATRSRLGQDFDFAPPQHLRLKGKGDVDVYRLLGRRTRMAAPMPAPAES